MKKIYLELLAGTLAFTRKKLSLLLILMFTTLFAQQGFGQILAFDFNGRTGGEATVTSTTTNANLSISTISRGTGLSIPAVGANRFVNTFDAIGYSTGTTSLATAITAQEYFQFTITVNAGFVASLSTLDAVFLRSSANAPTSFQWQYSLNAFATAGVNIGTAITYTGIPTTGTPQTQINLSGIAALQNVPSTTNITIRIYGWGAGNTGSTFALGASTGATINNDDLAIGGTVVPANTITTGAITGSPFCAGSTISVPFTSTGTYSGNTYTAQASNAAGSFAAPTSIGTLVSNANSGTITATIPLGTPSGTGYRIRVVSSNPVVTGTVNGANLTVTALPVATFNYAGTPYCQNAANPSPTFTGGGVAGTFTAPAALSINAATGQINLSSSTPGTYTVTNTIAASGGCGVVTATSSVTVTALPVATFSYAGTPYCKNAANPSPTFSGGGVAGTFTASPAGLSITAATGQINLSASTAGTYTVTNTIAAANGCGVVTATNSVTITTLPVAAFSYTGTPYCQTAANPSPTFSGGGVAGNFTASPAGLSITAATGQINLSASTPGTYTVTNTIAAAGGCGVVTATSSVTITALPVATFTYAGTPYCQDGTNPSPTFSGGGVAGNFTASPAGLSITAATGLINLSASTAGTYTVTNTIAAGGGCAIVTATSSITINQPVTITGFPNAATQTVCAASNVTYTVSATGTGVTYQWLLNGGNMTNGGRISGATTSALAITGVTLADDGDYSVVVSGSSPCTAATSGVAHLDVDQKIIFTAQPLTPQTICQGQTYTISATATGTVALYQWYKGATVYGPGTFDGTSTYTLSIPNVATTDIGSYRLLLDDGTGVGCTAANSNFAALNVNTSTTIAANPTATQTVCQNSTPTNLSVTAAGTGPFTYQWYSNSANDNTTGSLVGGATSSIYTPSTTATGTVYYYVIVTGNCNPATSATAAVIVNPTPSIAVKTATACSGTGFNVTPVDGTDQVPPGTTYSWSAPTVTGGLTGGAAGSNATSVTGTLTNPTNITQTATYTVIPTSGTCSGSTFTVTVTVTPTPLVTNQTPVTCSGTAFSVTPSNGGGNIVPTGTTYSWSAPTVTGGMTGGAAGTNATNITGTLTNTTNAPQTATYTVTPTSGACIGSTFTVTVTVNPNAAITAKTSTTCSGSAFSVIPVDGSGGDVIPSGTKYSWAAPVVTGGLTGGATGTNASSITGTLTNPTNTVQTATYTVTPTSGTCAGATFTVTVTVNPKPSIAVKTASTCSGTGFSVTPVNGTDIVPAGTSYSWIAPTVTGGLTGGAAGTNASSITGTLTNPTNTNQTATYTVTPTSGTCTGSTFTVTVTVTPTPFVSAQTSSTCSGTAFGVAPANGGGNIVPTGTTYSWSAPTVTGGMTGGASGTNAASITGTLTNSTNVAQTATYTVTPASGTCTGSTFTVTVTVNPKAAITAKTATTCSSSGFSVAPVDGVSGDVIPTGTTYSWGLPTVTGAMTGRATGTNATSITGTLVNPTNIPQTATYTVTPASGSCTGPTFTVTITVNPKPSVTAKTASTCSGTGFTVTPVDGGGSIVPAGTTYSWNLPVVTGGLTGGAIGTNATSITGTLINPTNTSQTATYTVTPTSGTCTGSTFTVTVTVTPTPFVTDQTTTTCGGAGFSVSPVNGVGGNIVPAVTRYAWSAPVVTGGMTGGTAATNQTNITGTLNNATATTQTATYTVTPSSGGCTGSTFTVTVTVNPLPTITTTGIVAPVCFSASGQNSTLAYTATTQSPITYSINWASGIVDVTNAALPTSPITIPIPAGRAPGTYTGTLTVKNVNGCVSSGVAVSITINPLPVPSLTNSPASPVCVNSTVTYTTDAGQSNYVWTFTGLAGTDYTLVSGGNSTSNTAVVTWITPVPNTKTVTVNYTNGNTCTAVTPTSKSITVLPVPTGSFTEADNSGIANNDNIICAGEPATFTAPSGYNGYTFKVNGVVVQGPNTTNTFSTSSLTDGQSVTVDIANASNCGATFGPIVISVKPIPSPALGADKTTICTGDLVTFTGSGTGISNYNFSINGVSQQSGASATFTSTTLAQGDIVTVDATNANKCIGTSNAITMTVNPLPTGSMTSTSTTVCTGTNITFTASGGVSYQFRINGSIAQPYGASNTFTSNSIPDASVVTVDVANGPNGTGCSTTYSPGIPVTIKPLPTGTVSATENSGISNDNKICLGAPVTFTFSNTGYSTYNFKINGVSKQSGSSNIFTTTALALSTDVVTVDVTSGGGCTANNFPAPSITIIAAPAGTLTASKNPICAGENVDFTATSDPTYTNYNFKVNGGSSVQTGSGNTYSSTTLSNGDVVTVDVTNTNGCISTFTAPTMIVNPAPTGTLVAVENSGTTSNDGIICTGAPVVFTAPGGFNNYNFILNGTSIQNGTSATYTPASLVSGDNVTVTVTNSGGCVGLLNLVTITINPLPPVASITGPNNVCLGSSIALSDATAGGVWTSLNTAIATVDATGAVTGVTAGTATINYTVTDAITGCTNTASASVTVNAPPTVAPITGNFNVCTGSTSSLDDATTGGSWSSGSTGVATVDPSTGVVSGVSPGTATISYTFTDANGCTTIVTADVTVNNLPVVAAITTTSPSGFNVCIGGTLPLKDATSGGTWSSSNTSVATINASGIVTGLTGGTTDITYSITTSCGQNATATQTVTVNAPPSATISYPGAPFCSSSAPAVVSQTGTAGGTYSSTAGLTINSTDGTITPATSTGGTYIVTYTIAAGGGCAVFSTTVSVTITATPSAIISYSGGPFCTTSSPVSVTRTGTAGGTYSSTAGLTINTANGTITPASSTNGTYTITYTIAAAGGCPVYTTTASVTINAAPSATISYAGSPFCTSSAPVPVTRTGTVGGTYASTAGLTIDGTTGTITPASSTAGTYSVTYTVAASGGCAQFTITTPVTITAAPSAVAGTAVATCSNNPPVNITAGSSATNYSSTAWTSSGTGTFTNANSLTTATYTPSAADIAAGSVTITLTATGNGSCGQAVSTKTLTISAPPTAFVLTPSGTVNVCQGNIQPLTATATSSTSSSVTVTSGTINKTIPDGNDIYFFGIYLYTIPGSTTSNLAVSTVPAGAVIDSIKVNFTITHTYDADLVLNLRAPNNKVLNLVYQKGASGDNFTNTSVNSKNTNSFAAGTVPFTGTFTPDGINGVGTPNSGNTVFSDLFDTPNGTWTFGAEDDDENDQGKIVDWSITINYTVPASPIPVIWSPVTDLYTNASATTAYAGTTLSTVYAKPSSAGTKVYTATATNAANCSTSQNVTLNVGTSPVVTVTADYCLVAGKVQLSAGSTPVGTSYLWSTGDVTQTILVDVAGIYSVTVYSAGSTCPGKGTINVANELVYNGNFELGNVGFTSAYPYRTGAGSLNNPPGYAVDTAANYYGPTFLWGKDHTTTHGKFMMVNGATGVNYQIWQQTISVLPNTTYYFSAWGLELDNLPNNPNPPFQPPANAQLQFNVNGAQVGTLGNLPRPVNPTRDQDNNAWVKFYGSWTSGPTTTSVLVSITDLQGAVYGNNFGLDDISFGTLSTFVELISAPGTDAQTVCVNNPIANIVYSAGSSASSPTVTGLPTGVTTSWNGIYLTISGTPTVAGNYSYTVTTTGSCKPASASGTITVQAQKITLSAGSSSPSVCVNTPVSIGYTLSGTATGATATGLAAAGLTLTVSGTSVTISGSPTAAGSYPYTITTSGTCAPVTTSGTITVTSQTVTLNSANDIQTVCINTPITNIRYTVGGTGTGASVSWTPSLPTGISGIYSGGIFTISGTPSVAGTFNYTVLTSGTCAGVTATGSITVTPAASLVLTSVPGTDAQTVCNNSPLTPITYAVNDATGASITSGVLPAGVTAAYDTPTKTFTISGTPTVSTGGVFNYTVTTSGGCATDSKTGSITVTAQTVTLTTGNASPSVCQNASMTPVVYTLSGFATGATISGQPSGITGTLAGTTFTISGTTSDPAGAYNYTITTSGGSCGSATATGTITVQAIAVAGSITPPPVICSGGSGTLTLIGNSSNPVRWESSATGAAPWTSIANTTISQPYTNVTSAIWYRAVVSNGCGQVYSNTVLVGVHNLWVGGTNNDWNTASNWSDNLVPSMSCATVTIPVVSGPNVYPVLSTGAIATINNLAINAGASLTVTGNTMQIAGTITSTGASFDASNGKIELNGGGVQTIAAATFMTNKVKDLVITNTAGVVLNGAVDVFRSLTYGAANAKLTTGGFLTLKSTATETAWIGDMTNHIITGDVTVERYIATGAHTKSWQLLAIPTQGQTIKAAWQEGATAALNTINGNTPATNPKPGYGTMLTSDVANAASQPTPGFDLLTTPGPSIKAYNGPTDTYIGPANTGLQIYDQRGYFTLVRGDRSVFTSTGTAVPTVLRTKGSLFTPANLPPSSTVIAGKFASVGNPYASAIDLRSISKSTQDFFIVWDPKLGGAYGLGGYVTLSRTGTDYFSTPQSPSYGAGPQNFIQSGQAFIVQAFGSNGTISFKEADKATGSSLVNRPTRDAGVESQLRTNIYGINAGGTYLADGTLIQYMDSYSDSIDGFDARKMTNTGENLAIKSAGSLLVIERRQPITPQDTIFLNLTGVKAQQYQFQFEADKLDADVEGFLEDNYLHTKTPVSMTGSTTVNFNVENIAGSYAPDRFRIVFAPSAVLPVTFTSVKAYREDKNIQVEWRVENETNMKQYEVEKSNNGTQFTTLTVKAASANGGRSAIYVTSDINPPAGYNYYRIKSVDINGKTAYTNVVKVLMGSLKQDITIYPNPITDGMIHLQLMNQPEGKYGLRLLNKLGQVIVSRQISHAEGSSTEIIKWDFNLAHGMYQLEVTRPDGSVKDINVLY